MIISRTPFRISFFGGGTDYPIWYRENGGAVLGTTIDKYCYISCRHLPPFFTHKHRIVYSQIETVKDINEIDHPSAREVLRFAQIDQGIEIHHDGDLPARTGLGSSSSFTVGLLNALYALKGVMPSKSQLARDAIHIEQDLIKESVGSQDQVLVALGGFNRVEFARENEFKVTPITIKTDRLDQLQKHLMLFFTGFSRKASDVAAEQIRQTPGKKAELGRMYEMVDEAIGILNSQDDLASFGKLLHEGWMLKRSMSSLVSNASIDEVYRVAIDAGGIGGKLLGAGGGGFILFFVPLDLQSRVRTALGSILNVPFRFENSGSQIIFFEPETLRA